MNAPVEPYTLPGFKTLLVGGVGTGKTHSLRTLVEAGLEVFAVFTEPGMEVVADIPSDKLHWKYISPSTVSWAAMADSAKKLNTLSFKSLTELPHINRGEHAEFLDMVAQLENFHDTRTGKFYGPVDYWGNTGSQYYDDTGAAIPQYVADGSIAFWEANAKKYGLSSDNNWGANRVLWVDSLSGINIMAMNLIAGSKPVKAPGDWACAMDNLERLVQKLTTDLKCHVVLTAHLEREADELTGGTTMMVSTLGKKLAPKIPRFFSDVIHVRRDEKTFSWSTVTANTDLKARNIAWAENMPPSFVPIVECWRKRAATSI